MRTIPKAGGLFRLGPMWKESHKVYVDQAHGTTRARLSSVKVKRKGQVTIPVELREKFKIQDGSLLEIHQHEEGILLRPAVPLQAGEVVGEEAYRKILKELASLRKKRR